MMKHMTANLEVSGLIPFSARKNLHFIIYLSMLFPVSNKQKHAYPVSCRRGFLTPYDTNAQSYKQHNDVVASPP